MTEPETLDPKAMNQPEACRLIGHALRQQPPDIQLALAAIDRLGDFPQTDQEREAERTRLARGLADVDAGRTRPAEEVYARLRAKYARQTAA